MDQERYPERASRAAVLSGAAVALVAVIGADLAMAPAMHRGSPKTVAADVRAASVSMPAASDAASALGWAAMALLALVVLRRSFLPLLAAPASLPALGLSRTPLPHILLRRRFVRAYRAGGRCGP